MTRIDTRWSLHSYRAVVLENRALRVVALPELGGRVWSIVYKLHDRELLWQNPRIPPQKVPFGAPFDNVWCGGWEEMFPTAVPGIINGESYPDHGELWCLSWQTEAETRLDRVILKLRASAPISGVEIEKHLVLRGDAPSLEVTYRLENLTRLSLPYLFALHPAFAVSPTCRLDLPPMRLEPDPSFPGTLTDVEPEMRWPQLWRRGKQVDLRTVYPASSGEVFYLYGHDFTEGWFAVTDTKSQLSWGMSFSPQFFPACWIFATYGGWRDYYALLIEPSTTFPAQVESAIEAGQAPILAPHESVETTVRFQVQEGLPRVSGLNPEGDFVE
jgi:galactose mutarotase-like enzyme